MFGLWACCRFCKSCTPFARIELPMIALAAARVKRIGE
jgi:hypothetical protein